MAAELCGDEWNAAHAAWQLAMPQVLASNSPHLALMAAAAAHQSAAWSARVPLPLAGLCTSWALGMYHAGGESLHALLSGSCGDASRQQAGQVLIAYAVPLVGWMLLSQSSAHLAHVDPHPGNFRWDAEGQARTPRTRGWVGGVGGSRRAFRAHHPFAVRVALDAWPCSPGCTLHPSLYRAPSTHACTIYRTRPHPGALGPGLGFARAAAAGDSTRALPARHVRRPPATSLP